MSNTSEVYTLRIAKAQNGWIIQAAGSAVLGGSSLSDAILVREGESLGDSIAAAIVAKKLTGDVEPSAYESQVQALQKLYADKVYSNQILNTPVIQPASVTTAQSIPSSAAPNGTITQTKPTSSKHGLLGTIFGKAMS